MLYLATLPEDCSPPVWPTTRKENKQLKRREARNKVNIVDIQYFPTLTNGMTRKLRSKTSRIRYYYYAAFNAPCVGHKDDESQAQYNRGFSFLADAVSLPTIKHAICLSFKKTTLHLIVPKTLATYSKKRLNNRRRVLLKMTMLSRNEWHSTVIM